MLMNLNVDVDEGNEMKFKEGEEEEEEEEEELEEGELVESPEVDAKNLQKSMTQIQEEIRYTNHACLSCDDLFSLNMLRAAYHCVSDVATSELIAVQYFKELQNQAAFTSKWSKEFCKYLHLRAQVLQERHNIDVVEALSTSLPEKVASVLNELDLENIKVMRLDIMQAEHEMFDRTAHAKEEKVTGITPVDSAVNSGVKIIDNLAKEEESPPTSKQKQAKRKKQQQSASSVKRKKNVPPTDSEVADKKKKKKAVAAWLTAVTLMQEAWPESSLNFSYQGKLY